jgi:hypothetical protein
VRGGGVRPWPHTPTDPDSIGNANRHSHPIAYVFADLDCDVRAPNPGAAHADGDGDGDDDADFDGHRFSDRDRFTGLAITNFDGTPQGHRDSDADELDSHHASPKLDCKCHRDARGVMHRRLQS